MTGLQLAGEDEERQPGMPASTSRPSKSVSLSNTSTRKETSSTRRDDTRELNFLSIEHGRNDTVEVTPGPVIQENRIIALYALIEFRHE